MFCYDNSKKERESWSTTRQLPPVSFRHARFSTEKLGQFYEDILTSWVLNYVLVTKKEWRPLRLPNIMDDFCMFSKFGTEDCVFIGKSG